MPEGLRARVAADLAPVRPLPPPLARALWMLPVAAVLLVAAPLVFEWRPQAARLGWAGTWGLSMLQGAVAIAVVWAALTDAVPGRGWTRGAAAAILALPVGLVIAITGWSWIESPVALARGWWLIGGLCFTGSAVSALPAAALASVLAVRAYPTHPVRTGAMLGLGAGLMADAGWRLFCHYSEPAHVLTAHLGGVLAAVAAGVVLTRVLHGGAPR